MILIFLWSSRLVLAGFDVKNLIPESQARSLGREHFLYVRFRAQTCRSSILEETMVTGEGTESDLPATNPDGCVECDYQESDPCEWQSKGVISALRFLRLVIAI